MATKTIICADALDWLGANHAGAVVTSPPDAEEIGAGLKEWEIWFAGALDACLVAAPVAAFYVTDRKSDGALRSKAALVFDAATRARRSISWHKIALRRAIGRVDLHRPGFSHVIAVGARSGSATPDVFERGRTLYANGTGLVAARVMVEWAAKSARQIVDPFCGRGTIPAVAVALGFDAVGIDLDERQCEHARQLSLRARSTG